MDRRHWLKAFPIQEASKAVEVVLDGWKDLSSRNSTKFCHTEKEPKLTTMLRLYIKDYKAMNAGLLGQWGAEQTEGMLLICTLMEPPDLQLMEPVKLQVIGATRFAG